MTLSSSCRCLAHGVSSVANRNWLNFSVHPYCCSQSLFHWSASDRQVAQCHAVAVLGNNFFEGAGLEKGYTFSLQHFSPSGMGQKGREHKHKLGFWGKRLTSQWGPGKPQTVTLLPAFKAYFDSWRSLQVTNSLQLSDVKILL